VTACDYVKVKKKGKVLQERRQRDGRAKVDDVSSKKIKKGVTYIEP
jgi:hypothetical protein